MVETIPQTDANAVIHIRTSTMKKIFNVAIDGNEIGDIDDPSGNNMWFFIDISNNISTTSITNLSDPSNCGIWMTNDMSAIVTNGYILSQQPNGIDLSYNQLQIVQDYNRYIAKELLKNGYTTDLFKNNRNINNLLYTNGRDNINNVNMSKLMSIDIVHAQYFGKNLTSQEQNTINSSGYSGIDNSGNQYVTNAWDSSYNIGLNLLRQLKHYDPNRFVNYFDEEGENFVSEVTSSNVTKKKFLYPFISGDSFSYVLKISSEPNQAKLVNSNENISIRTYHIQYKMQDDNDFELNKLQNKVNTNYYTDLSMNGYSDTNQISVNMENIIPKSEIGL